MAQINQLFPSKFLKYDDLQGKRVVVTITEAKVGEYNGKPTVELRFKGTDKQFSASRINCMAIAEAVGSTDTDDWIGKRVTLFPTKIEVAGQWKPCVRVDPVPPPPPANANGSQQKPAPPPPPAMRSEFDDDIDADCIPF